MDDAPRHQGESPGPRAECSPPPQTRLTPTVDGTGPKAERTDAKMDDAPSDRTRRQSLDCRAVRTQSAAPFSHGSTVGPVPATDSGQAGRLEDWWIVRLENWRSEDCNKKADGRRSRPRSSQPKGAGFRTRARARCRRRSSTNDRSCAPIWHCRHVRRHACCRRAGSRCRRCSP